MTKKSGKSSAIPPEHLQAIGNVAVQWALLEKVIHCAFCEFLELPHEKGRYIAAKIRRIEELTLMIEQHGNLNDSQKVEFSEFRVKVIELDKERDDVLHRQWWHILSEPGTIEGFRGTHASTLRSRPPPAKKKASEIEELATKLNWVSFWLTHFLIRTRGLHCLQLISGGYP